MSKGRYYICEIEQRPRVVVHGQNRSRVSRYLADTLINIRVATQRDMMTVTPSEVIDLDALAETEIVEENDDDAGGEG